MSLKSLIIREKKSQQTISVEVVIQARMRERLSVQLINL